MTVPTVGKTQEFTRDYRSEHNQFNGNHFYGSVSISVPHQKETKNSKFTPSDPKRAFTAWNNGDIDETSEFGLGETLSWDDCLQSLRSEELNDREQVIDRPIDGTCEWLLDAPEYLRWIDEHGLLLVRGKLGCGKSTLMKFAVNKQMEFAAESGALVLSFFFCASGTVLQNGTAGLLRTLLLQLLDQDDGCRSTFLDICRKRWITGGKKKLHMAWDEKELQVNFQKMVLECSARRKVTIFVDAIDECRDQDRASFISFFHTLKGKEELRLKKPRICFACRPYPDGQMSADFQIRLEERNQYDIERFVEQELRLDETPEDAETLKHILKNKADGLFIWLVLIIPKVHDMSGKGLNLEAIQSDILQCPPELNSLYQGLLSKIEETELLEVYSLFQCICFSARPLSPDELRIAMNIQLSGRKESLRQYEDQKDSWCIPNAAKMKKRIIYLSSGLVDITTAKSTEGNTLVGFCHDTIKDFMLKEGLDYLNARLGKSQSLTKDASFQLANTCLQYLSIKEIRIASLGERMSPSASTQFICYAADYWLSHAIAAERERFGEGIVWSDQSLLDIWREVSKDLGDDLPRDLVEGTALMHTPPKHGLESLARRIVRQSAQENKSSSIKKQ